MNMDRTSRLPGVRETLGQFDAVLDTDIGIATRPHALGDVYGVCQFAAKQLGLGGNPTRGAPAPDAGIADTAHALGLATHEVELAGDWWRADHGMLIVRERESGRPVLVASDRVRCGMTATYPDRLGAFEPVDEARAAGLERQALAVYVALPDTALTFGGILRRTLSLHPFEATAFILLTALTAILTYSIPVASGLIVDHAVPHRDYTLLMAIVGAVVACNLAMLALRYTAELIARRIEGSAGSHLQAGLLDRLLRFPLGFFARHNSADLMRRIVGLETARRTVLRLISTTLVDTVTLLTGLGVLVWYYPTGGLVVAIATLVCLVLAFLLSRHSYTAYLEGETMTANVLTIVYELVGNMLAIRASGAEQRAYARWRDDFVEMRRRTVRSTRYADVFACLQQAINLILMAVVFGLVAYNVTGIEGATVGDYVAFVSALSLATGSVGSLAASCLAAYSIVPQVQRAAPLLAAVPEAGTVRRRPQPLAGRIQLVDVTYRYTDDAPAVLDEVNVDLRPGEYVGIVGASGAGKSTLLRLVLGLLAPSRGKVLLDQNDLATVDADEVRRQIGVVLQDCRLFPGSLLENLSEGRAVDPQRVLEALDRVGIGAYVRSLPMGVHTMVGEGATTFSGGQVQLIALARALVGDPRLLVIDEGSSALDNVSQQQVCAVLESLPMTRLVSTHRLGTLARCDRILVVEGGQIRDAGTYAEFAAGDGRFNRMLTGEKE